MNKSTLRLVLETPRKEHLLELGLGAGLDARETHEAHVGLLDALPQLTLLQLAAWMHKARTVAKGKAAKKPSKKYRNEQGSLGWE